MKLGSKEITRICYNAVREWDGDMSVPVFDELTPEQYQWWTDKVQRVIDNSVLEGDTFNESDRVIDAVVAALR